MESIDKQSQPGAVRLNCYDLVHSTLDSNSTKKVAFTLAEVLITLGIIGVVAALTIPSLIANYKYKEYATAIKKQYSVINQAIEKSAIDNGDVVNWDYTLSYENFSDKYITPYIKASACEKSACWLTAMTEEPKGFWFEEPAYALQCNGHWRDNPDSNGYYCGGGCGSYYCCNGSNCWNCEANMSEADCKDMNSTNPKIFYTLLDGAVIGLYKKDSLVIHVDINGAKKPNKKGYDQFEMVTNNHNQVSMVGNGAKLQANNWEFDKKYIDSIEE